MRLTLSDAFKPIEFESLHVLSGLLEVETVSIAVVFCLDQFCVSFVPTGPFLELNESADL